MPANLRILFVLLSLLLLSTSCALDHNRYIPVFTSQPRISTLGFSIKPPPGSGWYEKINDGSLYYLKRLQEKNYFMYTRATEVHFNYGFSGGEAFLNYVRSQKSINNDPTLFKNTRNSYQQSDKYGSCVRYQQSYDDHSKKEKQRNTTTPLPTKVTTHGLICIHPDDPLVGIDLYYLERTIPGQEIVTYTHEGERFLDSLSFIAPAKTPL